MFNDMAENNEFIMPILNPSNLWILKIHIEHLIQIRIKVFEPRPHLLINAMIFSHVKIWLCVHHVWPTTDIQYSDRIMFPTTQCSLNANNASRFNNLPHPQRKSHHLPPLPFPVSSLSWS